MSDIQVGSEWVHRSGSKEVFIVTDVDSIKITYRVVGGYGQSVLLIVDFLSTFRPRLNSDKPRPLASIAAAIGSDKTVTCDSYSIDDDTPVQTPSSLDAGKMRLIGIAGPARAGKDTLASYLLDNLSNDWSRSSFADPLKEMLRAIGVDCSDENKPLINSDYGVTPRHMMQTLGTEWGRHMIDGDIWVKAFARLNAGKCVIVPDVRFENEADLVREHGVLIHLVGRGGIEGSHVSENAIEFKAGDIVIDNSRDLAWLNAQVDNSDVLARLIAGVGE